MREKIQINTNIYASCDLKCLILPLPDLEIPAVNYICFQMEPLRSILLLCVSNKTRLHMDLFRPFIPKSVESGDRVQTSLGKDCELGLTTNEELRQKLALMHQASLCEF